MLIYATHLKTQAPTKAAVTLQSEKLGQLTFATSTAPLDNAQRDRPLIRTLGEAALAFISRLFD